MAMEEAMEIARYEEELEAPDELNEDAITKYKMAAEIVNTAVARIVAMIQPGADVALLCAFGDQFIHEKLSSVFSHGQVEKGPAFPTCISVDACAGNFAPNQENVFFLQEGNCAKITLGAQIDGYIAMSSHTHVVPMLNVEARMAPVEGKIADVIAATHLAGEAVHRLLRPGTQVSDIVGVINGIAADFHCKAVLGNFICNSKRFVLEGTKVIWNTPADEDHEQADFVICENDVFNVDIMLSTGEGKLRPGNDKPTVYQRDLTRFYNLKIKASRNLYGEITEKFPTMPFNVRHLEPRNASLGMKECVTHGLLTPFPINYERAGQHVAQVKYTAVVQARETTRLTSHEPPYIHSAYAVTDEAILEVLSRPARKDGPRADALAGMA